MNSTNELKSKRAIELTRGFITLISTLVVGAVGLSIALSLILLGLGSARTSLATQQLVQARALADSCAEEALGEISESSTFTGTGNLSLGGGDCSFDVSSSGGENRHIDAEGTVGTIIRRLSIDIDQIKPGINITSWQEVP